MALARVGFSVMVGGTPVSVPEGYEFLVTRIGPNGESGFAVPLGGARAAAVVGGPSGTFIVGTFAGGVRLGERRLTGDHASDHFVARLDANGGVAWLKAYGPAEIFTSVPSGALSNEGASC